MKNSQMLILILFASMLLLIGVSLGWYGVWQAAFPVETVQCVPENCDDQGRCTYYPVI